MRVTILGCGTSGGIPVIGNRWGACDPSNPRNRRSRASAMVEWNGKKILLDSSPDLRSQLLAYAIDDVDAVLYTHIHADHTHGINDLCLLSRRKNAPIPVYGDSHTVDGLLQSFEYAFRSPDNDHYLPFLKEHVIEPERPFSVFDLQVYPFPQDHGIIQTLGFRLGSFAYSTDVRRFEESVLQELKEAQLGLWVVDCLQLEPHRTHSHLEQTLRWIDFVKPKRAVLTHLSPHLDYATLAKNLPKDVEPAYDGLVVELED